MKQAVGRFEVGALRLIPLLPDVPRDLSGRSAATELNASRVHHVSGATQLPLERCHRFSACLRSTDEHVGTRRGGSTAIGGLCGGLQLDAMHPGSARQLAADYCGRCLKHQQGFTANTDHECVHRLSLGRNSGPEIHRQATPACVLDASIQMDPLVGICSRLWGTTRLRSWLSEYGRYEHQKRNQKCERSNGGVPADSRDRQDAGNIVRARTECSWPSMALISHCNLRKYPT